MTVAHPPTLKLYNTLTQNKEQAVFPTNAPVQLYHCGPTVYGTQHIGNLRRTIMSDILVRTLKHAGYKATSITNITDVGHLTDDENDTGEDKMIVAAQKEGKTPAEIADIFTNIFFKDLRALNVDGVPKKAVTHKEPIKNWPRATEHIQHMAKIAVALKEQGYAYETSQGIYFDITKADHYGKLSGNTLEALQAGARVEVDAEKRNPADFALWIKAPKEHLMKWDPKEQWSLDLPIGYPGWHIECSAMALEHAGEYVDIHTGGIDNKFPHHENEIAQSESYLQKPFVGTWMHAEHVVVDSKKMSKSVGNVVLLNDLLAQYKEEYTEQHIAMSFRLLCLAAHYRSRINYTEASFQQALKNYETLQQFVWELERNPESQQPKTTQVSFQKEFEQHLYDDMATQEAVTLLFEKIKQFHSGTLKEEPAALLYFFKITLQETLGLLFEELQQIPQEDYEKAKQLDQAREEKDYETADSLREELQQHYQVETTATGTQLTKK